MDHLRSGLLGEGLRALGWEPALRVRGEPRALARGWPAELFCPHDWLLSEGVIIFIF